MNEIGSEFWKAETNDNTNDVFMKNKLFMMSGRTALELIVRDVLSSRKMEKVYVPSYACHTMIKPFLDHNIEIKFYEVVRDKNGGFSFNIDLKEDFDAILLIQYFGYYDSNVKLIATEFRSRDVIVIEDVTHSMFIEGAGEGYTDYTFGSLRKWTGFFTGGFCSKAHGDFNFRDEVKDAQNEYCLLRSKAMYLKNKYIKSEIKDKKEFLELFSKAEDALNKDCYNYSIDPESLSVLKEMDLSFIKQRRKENANFLLERIREVPILEPVFPDIKCEDVPLFVPVMVSNGQRDRLREYLVQNNIYCPVHWCLTKYHTISERSRDIYEGIMSLVCDQRYSLRDMELIINKIRNFQENKM